MWNKILIVICLLAGSAWSGQQETIDPTDTSNGFSQWDFKNTTKIGSITDNDDATFAFSVSTADTDRYIMANPAQDYTDYVIDSVKHFKRLRYGGALVSGNLRVSAIVGSDTAHVNLSFDDITGSFADYGFNFPASVWPDGEWSETDVDNLLIQSTPTSLSALDSILSSIDSTRIYASSLLSSGGSTKADGFSTFYGVSRNTEIQHFASNIGTVFYPVDTPNFEIPASALANGSLYWVKWGMGIGGRLTTALPEAIIVYGTDTLAHVVYESGAGTNPRASDCQLQGHAIIEANGTDSIIAWIKNAVNDSIYSRGRYLSCVDLSNLDSNTHFWKAQTAFSDAEVIRDTNNTNSSDTTLVAGTWTFPAGDYLVLGYGESRDSSGNVSNGGRAMYMYIDGAARKKTGKLTWEAHRDWTNFSFAEVITLSGASHTFQIRGGNRDNNTADVIMRRGYIVIHALSIRPDYALSQIATDSTISTTWSTYKNYMSVSLTPSVTQDMIAIGNCVTRNTAGNVIDIHRGTRLNNTTDAVVHCDYSPLNPRDDEDTTYSSSFGFVVAASSAKTFLFQTVRESNNNTTQSSDGTLILLGMKENVSAPPAATPTRLPQMKKIIIGAKEESPIEYAKEVLGLRCRECEEENEAIDFGFVFDSW